MTVTHAAPRLKASGRAFAQISEFHPELTAFRRDLHAHPELGFEEVYTAARVKESLQVCGVDAIHTGIGKTGLVATIKGRGGNSHKMVGLRADMDALPMQEHNKFPHASIHAGRMHACGHDGHTTMLLGGATLLSRQPDFNGTVHFIFQPGEEGDGGARFMIDQGVTDGVDAAFALQRREGANRR